MKSKPQSPAVAKSNAAGVGHVRHGGFGVSTVKKKPPNNVSMTPGTFERSQSRLKKTPVRRRHSLYDVDTTTQVFADDSQLDLSQDDSQLDHTPITLSQISAIDAPDHEALIRSARKRRRQRQAQNDDTLEMAVQCARGEPDGAERSFTRQQLEKFSLDDSENKESDMSMEGVEEEMDSDNEDESPSPAKKSKKEDKAAKTPKTKNKKTTLKIPFHQAAKKLKSLKSAGDARKSKKVNKNFEALPDETTIPKTPNQTWKEKKQQRKMMKNNYDLITTAKKSWEELRRHDLPVAKKAKICDELKKLIIGKVKELSMVHDSARVVQCLVQYGSEQQRVEIFEEIKGDLCELCKQKYAKYVVRKLIHYGSKELRGQVFACFHGNVRKMIRHKEASDILEYAFNEYATAPQRLSVLEEFYGPTFSLFKDRVHQSLDQIMTDQPEKKEMVIRSMKEALAPLIDKELLSYSLVHKVFADFFVYADDKSKKEMIEGLREHIPSLLHTRDGTRVAMKCMWCGSAKDRKMMVKSLKTHVVKVCKEEHGHLLLLSIFDCVDDTVLVQKVILDELLNSLDDVIQNQHGKKVLLYLLCRRDPHHFHPDIVKVLQEGDSNSTSKKDPAIRAQELLAHLSEPMLKYLETNTLSMMSNNNIAPLVTAIITFATGDVVPAMRAIAELVAQPCSTAGGAINMVEHPACHITLKKIIANDKARMLAGEGILFSAILLEALPKSTVKIWAASNRGCFMLVSLLEVGCSTITERVKSHLQPVLKSLNRMTFKGAELLLQKLEYSKTKEYKV